MEAAPICEYLVASSFLLISTMRLSITSSIERCGFRGALKDILIPALFIGSVESKSLEKPES